MTLKVRDKNAGSIAVKTQGVENERVEMPDQKPGLEIAAAKMRHQNAGPIVINMQMSKMPDRA